MKNLKIYLFRHGQTYYNEKGIFTGQKKSKLTPKGIKNTKTIAKKLKNKKFQVAFYTHLPRSKNTLKYVLKYHLECKKLIEDDRMIERSYGRLSGMSHKKFIEKKGKVEYDKIHRGYNTPPPKGESFAMVEKRVKAFITDLKKFMKKEKVNVAISAHGNSIRLFRKIMENVSKKEIIKWVIPYDNYYEYSLDV